MNEPAKKGLLAALRLPPLSPMKRPHPDAELATPSLRPHVSMRLDDPVPRPMPADCKLVVGKIKNGPKFHVMCVKHGHVIDAKTRQVIANSLAEYAQTTTWMDGEDMSTHSKDGEIARTAQTTHDTAPVLAEMEKKTADIERKALLARYHDVAASAHTAVLATTTKYTVAVAQACERFQAYALKYIDEMKAAEADDLFRDIAGYLYDTAISLLPGGPVINELSGKAKQVAEDMGKQLVKFAEKELKQGLISLIPKKAGSDALKTSLATLVAQAKVLASQIGNQAEMTVGADLQRIADSAGKGSALADEDEAYIKPFLERDFNEVLEAFRIPSDKSALALQKKIYGGLVKEFYAEYYQQHRLSEGLRLEDDREAHRIGDKHAKEEVDKLESEVATQTGSSAR